MFSLSGKLGGGPPPENGPKIEETKTMGRAIIQICVTPGYTVDTHKGRFHSPGGVVALCDDGSLWRLPDGNEKYNDAWFRLADIPQDKEAKKPNPYREIGMPSSLDLADEADF